MVRVTTSLPFIINPFNWTKFSFVCLFFTNQNISVKGGSNGHGKTGYPRACTLASVWRRVAYLWCHDTSGRTPLASVYSKIKSSNICSAYITKDLREAVKIMGPRVGFKPKDFIPSSMCSGETIDGNFLFRLSQNNGNLPLPFFGGN